MAQQFLAAGSRLILSDLDSKALSSLKAECGEKESSVVACIAADLSDQDGCRSLMSEVLSADECPDILINNAGIAVSGRLDHVPQEKWEPLLQINLLAPIRLTSILLPRMIERGSGHIVNISSLAGWVGSPVRVAWVQRSVGAGRRGIRNSHDNCVSVIQSYADSRFRAIRFRSKARGPR